MHISKHEQEELDLLRSHQNAFVGPVGPVGPVRSTVYYIQPVRCAFLPISANDDANAGELPTYTRTLTEGIEDGRMRAVDHRPDTGTPGDCVHCTVRTRHVRYRTGESCVDVFIQTRYFEAP